LGNAEGERLKWIRDIHSWKHKKISLSFHECLKDLS
jgi:hypothetical protein